MTDDTQRGGRGLSGRQLIIGGASAGGATGTASSTAPSTDPLQMWEAPNVFVVGADNFPQNAGFNPTGTLGGPAYRAADGIVNHYIKSPGPIRS